MPRSSPHIVSSEREVKAARPRGARGEYRVRGMKNLVLRVSPAGGKHWSFHYRLPKERKWRAISVGPWPTISLGQAKDDALKLTLALRDGKDPREVLHRQRLAKDALTFRHLALEYLAEHEIKCARHGKKSRWTSEVERVLNRNVFPEIGDYGVEVVTRADVSKVVEKVAKRGSYRAAYITLGIVRSVFVWGNNTGRLDGVDPTCGLQKRNGNGKRERKRTLSDDEIRTFWRRLDEPGQLSAAIRDALRLELIVGVRVGEAVGATKTEFDLRKKLWTIPGKRSKNRRDHIVPLSDLALEIIERAMNRAPDSPWLFPSPHDDGPIRPKSASRAVLRIQRQWGRQDGQFATHDLRRTLATRMGEMDVADGVIDLILGHTPQTVAGRHYIHSRQLRKMRRALDMWASELKHILSGADAASLTDSEPDHDIQPLYQWAAEPRCIVIDSETSS
jgi:integrase